MTANPASTGNADLSRPQPALGDLFARLSAAYPKYDGETVSVWIVSVRTDVLVHLCDLATDCERLRHRVDTLTHLLCVCDDAIYKQLQSVLCAIPNVRQIETHELVDQARGFIGILSANLPAKAPAE